MLLVLPSLRQADGIIRRFWSSVYRTGKVQMNKLFEEMLENVCYRWDTLGRHKFDNARRQDHAVVYCKLTMFTTNVIIYYCNHYFEHVFQCVVALSKTPVSDSVWKKRSYRSFYDSFYFLINSWIFILFFFLFACEKDVESGSSDSDRCDLWIVLNGYV